MSVRIDMIVAGKRREQNKSNREYAIIYIYIPFPVNK